MFKVKGTDRSQNKQAGHRNIRESGKGKKLSELLSTFKTGFAMKGRRDKKQRSY